MDKDPGILNLIYEAHRFLQTLESEPRDYGTGDILYSTDVHTVVAISRNPGCNLTMLAEDLDVSKAAVSKFVKKLIGLGYVRKEKSSRHGREVLFTLTTKGEEARNAHHLFERKVFGPLVQVVDSLSESDREIVRGFLMKLYDAAYGKQQ